MKREKCIPWGKAGKGYEIKGDIKRALTYSKRCSLSLAIKSVQIETTLRYYFSIEWMKAKSGAPFTIGKAGIRATLTGFWCEYITLLTREKRLNNGEQIYRCTDLSD